MRHLNKGSGTKAVYRGNSSIGVIGHARAAFLVAADPHAPNRRILACIKNNYGPTPPSLAFSLVPDGGICKIGWEGTAKQTADDLLQAPPTTEEQEQAQDKQSKIQSAISILTALLNEGNGQVEITKAKAECSAAALSLSTVDRAIKHIGLQIKYTTDNDGKRRYYWYSNNLQGLTE